MVATGVAEDHQGDGDDNRVSLRTTRFALMATWLF